MADKDTCFIVCPIGADDSAERKRSDRLMKYIIQPAIGELYDIERADKIAESGSITTQIVVRLGNSKLVIADITDMNPNVMYEVGIRHALQTPYIHMMLRGGKLPFDIVDHRTVWYEFAPEDVEAAVKNLRAQVDTIRNGTWEPPLAPFLPQINQTSGHNAGFKEALAPVYGAVSQLIREVSELKVEVGTATAIHRDNKQMEVMGQLMTAVVPTMLQNPEKLQALVEMAQKLPNKST